MKHRIEKDLLGERRIPADALWGIHTARARENFPFHTPETDHELIHAYALVKKACALANKDLGYLDTHVADAIIRACDEVAAGSCNDAFMLPWLQGGAGTSTNMNCNEVIANRACAHLGYEYGRTDIVHPLSHVNLHQSTNDTYPTATKIAVIRLLQHAADAAAALQGSLQIKERQWADIIAIGRTEMQDAVPMTLGTQFGAMAQACARDRWRCFKAQERLRMVNLGGTAVGTGLGAPRDYIFLVIEHLRTISQLGLARAEYCTDQTANTDAFVEALGMLAPFASSVTKIARDLRTLHYLEEIELPPVQAGSSMMPGKVNPVICEAAVSAAMKAQLCIDGVGRCAGNGSGQINEFMPMIAAWSIETIRLLTSAAQMLAAHVDNTRAREDICRAHAFRSPTLITAFVPSIGYDRAQQIVQKYHQLQSTQRSEASFVDFLTTQLGEELVFRILSPANLRALGYTDEDDSEIA